MSPKSEQEKLSQSYWAKRWLRSDTPWILPEEDPPLLRTLEFARGRKLLREGAALVPLCGDSASVRVLYDAGFQVTGVEFVPAAIRALKQSRFSRLAFKISRKPGVVVHTAPRINLLRMDMLTFRQESSFDLIYDRAALVALLPKQRSCYLNILHRALKPGGLLALVGFTYKGGTLIGPPFAIGATEVRKSFPGYRCLLKEARTTRELREKLRTSGVTSVTDYLLVLRKPKSR